MKRATVPALLALLTSTSGCALQETTGAGWTGRRHAVATETVTATLHALRHSNGVVGVRAGTVVSDGLALKHGILHGGYDWRVWPGRLTLEPGIDLGAGAPLSHDLGGLGAYAGAAGSARLRLFGLDDAEPAFYVYGFAVELVVLPRVGFWVPPESAPSQRVYGEWAIEGGFRVVLASDLFVPSDGRVIDGSSAEQGNGGAR
jgi:hypothetical protein